MCLAILYGFYVFLFRLTGVLSNIIVRHNRYELTAIRDTINNLIRMRLVILCNRHVKTDLPILKKKTNCLDEHSQNISLSYEKCRPAFLYLLGKLKVTVKHCIWHLFLVRNTHLYARKFSWAISWKEHSFSNKI